jgi:hypothetical protein
MSTGSSSVTTAANGFAVRTVETFLRSCLLGPTRNPVPKAITTHPEAEEITSPSLNTHTKCILSFENNIRHKFGFIDVIILQYRALGIDAVLYIKGLLTFRGKNLPLPSGRSVVL